jgi:hypothetical protein
MRLTSRKRSRTVRHRSTVVHARPTESFRFVVEMQRQDQRGVVFEEFIGEVLPPLMIAFLRQSRHVRRASQRSFRLLRFLSRDVCSNRRDDIQVRSTNGHPTCETFAYVGLCKQCASFKATNVHSNERSPTGNEHHAAASVRNVLDVAVVGSEVVAVAVAAADDDDEKEVLAAAIMEVSLSDVYLAKGHSDRSNRRSSVGIQLDPLLICTNDDERSRNKR